MDENPYGGFQESDLTLRDRLATARTVLANERTILAYIRTALALVIAGAFLIKFIDSFAMQLIGWLCMPIGAGMIAFGIARYRKMNAQLAALDAEKNRDPNF